MGFDTCRIVVAREPYLGGVGASMFEYVGGCGEERVYLSSYLS